MLSSIPPPIHDRPVFTAHYVVTRTDTVLRDGVDRLRANYADNADYLGEHLR